MTARTSRRCSKRLAKRLAPGKVLGIDTAGDVIAAARREHPDVAFEVADVYKMPFDEGTWDVVHAHQVLQHVPDPVGALKQMRRVVHPGGIVAVRDADYAAFTWYPRAERLDRWLSLYRDIARANGGEPGAGRHLLSWAQQAGFVRIEPTASTWCFATPADRAWWGGLWADRMTTSAIAQQAEREGRATAEELASIAEAWRGWAGGRRWVACRPAREDCLHALTEGRSSRERIPVKGWRLESERNSSDNCACDVAWPCGRSAIVCAVRSVAGTH